MSKKRIAFKLILTIFIILNIISLTLLVMGKIEPTMSDAIILKILSILIFLNIILSQ